MEIKDHMIKDVITCQQDDSVIYATKKMADYNIGAVVIVDQDKPIGIFTERDLVKRVVAAGKNPAKLKVREVMSTELITIDAKQSVGAAFHLLISHKVRHAPIVEDKRLVGIVSQKDLGKVLDDRFYMTYFGKYQKPDFSGEY